MQAMQSLGFEPRHVDLRRYFGDADGLTETLRQFDVVWVMGGNAFILRKAMQQGGLGRVIEKLIRTNQLAYAGYSAALCVISPTLDGVELVDDVDASAEGYDPETKWEGYGLIDWYPVVHYRLDHPESALAERVLAYIRSKGRKYKTLRDGNTVVIDTDG